MSSVPLPGADLIALGALARKAGRDILRLYEAGCAHGAKADGSLVTEADQAAEAIILAGLAQLWPGAPVIAEEEVAADRAQTAGDQFFLVDPLDGTRDFVETRTGEFTVNIGLVANGRPTLGAVYQPTSGTLYLGGPEGAFRAAADPRSDAPAAFAPIRVADRSTDLRLTASRRNDGLADFIRALGAGAPTPMSSSIKFCLVAEGAFDLYPRFGPVSEWDAAAGHAVLVAAGGSVIGTDGAPLTYGGRIGDYAVPGFIACGGPKAEARACAAFKPPAGRSGA